MEPNTDVIPEQEQLIKTTTETIGNLTLWVLCGQIDFASGSGCF